MNNVCSIQSPNLLVETDRLTLEFRKWSGFIVGNGGMCTSTDVQNFLERPLGSEDHMQARS